VNAASEDRNDWGFPANGVTAHVPVNAGNFRQDVDNSVNKTMPWVVLVAIVSCSMGGAALGISIGSRDTANRSERESRLQRLEIDEMKVALQVQGIKVHEGSTP
jgi:hypothetical protein